MSRPPVPPFNLDPAILKTRLAEDAWNSRESRACRPRLHGRQPLAEPHACEWRDAGHCWFRAYGNENWEFDAEGLMRRRIASINDAPIAERDRLFRWPLGRRPDDHPSLSDLGL